MNKYTELSDFEVNKKVAYLFLNDGYYEIDSYRQEVMYFRSGSGKGLYRDYDPCNNPSDAMPIIIENLISLMADMSDGRESTWWCASDISNGFTSNYKSNPLRAAMEVFLMIKDAENEKV